MSPTKQHHIDNAQISSVVLAVLAGANQRGCRMSNFEYHLNTQMNAHCIKVNPTQKFNCGFNWTYTLCKE